ncbi:MAG: homocysteine S-methyltransferase family protein [Gemmatales bacterium]|nr:homocysteine S-methyltransferase family protein [Gemmatales bacterium]MDW7993036.1 homocysteine S-methyltransferase family protein [Gemmatales bacterium]
MREPIVTVEQPPEHVMTRSPTKYRRRSTAQSLLHNWLASERVVLMDGAMGTELLRRHGRALAQLTVALTEANCQPECAQRILGELCPGRKQALEIALRLARWRNQTGGWTLGDSLALMNLLRPDWVQQVHVDYLRAGAQCLVTNTFLAWPRTVSVPRPVERYYRRINRWAIHCAREAITTVGRIVPVVASVGPWPNASSNGVAQCLQQIRSLRQAHALFLETQHSLNFVQAVLTRLKPTFHQPIFVSFTFRRRGQRLVTWPTQHSARQIAQWAERYRGLISVLGVNCGYNLEPQDVSRILREFRRFTSLQLLARPSAGTPQPRGSRLVYPRRREYLESAVSDLVAAGARWIGGCCGSTPRDISAMRKRLRRSVASLSLQLAE